MIGKPRGAGGWRFYGLALVTCGSCGPAFRRAAGDGLRSGPGDSDPNGDPPARIAGCTRIAGPPAPTVWLALATFDLLELPPGSSLCARCVGAGLFAGFVGYVRPLSPHPAPGS